MPHLFSQPQNIQGGFRADQVSVSISGLTAGMLITSVGINFEQPINMIYALENQGTPTGVAPGANNTGGNNVYMIAGRPRGAAQIERIIGPSAISSQWLSQFGNACNVINNTMQFSAAAGNCVVGSQTSTTGQYTMSGCIITRFSMNVTSEQAIIRNAIEMQFADLVLPDNM